MYSSGADSVFCILHSYSVYVYEYCNTTVARKFYCMLIYIYMWYGLAWWLKRGNGSVKERNQIYVCVFRYSIPSFYLKLANNRVSIVCIVFSYYATCATYTYTILHGVTTTIQTTYASEFHGMPHFLTWFGFICCHCRLKCSKIQNVCPHIRNVLRQIHQAHCCLLPDLNIWSKSIMYNLWWDL